MCWLEAVLTEYAKIKGLKHTEYFDEVIPIEASFKANELLPVFIQRNYVLTNSLLSELPVHDVTFTLVDDPKALLKKRVVLMKTTSKQHEVIAGVSKQSIAISAVVDECHNISISNDPDNEKGKRNRLIITDIPGQKIITPSPQKMSTQQKMDI